VKKSGMDEDSEEMADKIQEVGKFKSLSDWDLFMKQFGIYFVFIHLFFGFSNLVLLSRS